MRLISAIACVILLTLSGCHVFEKDYVERLGRLVEVSEVMSSAGGDTPTTQKSEPPAQDSTAQKNDTPPVSPPDS